MTSIANSRLSNDDLAPPRVVCDNCHGLNEAVRAAFPEAELHDLAHRRSAARPEGPHAAWQGGFNRSSQRSIEGGCDGREEKAAVGSGWATGGTAQMTSPPSPLPSTPGRERRSAGERPPRCSTST